jgi:hypothetical protein
MLSLRAELHVHTVLSPCAGVEMIPPLIVQRALEFGLDIIAITDHNTSANIAAVQRAAVGTRLAVLPGMELQTREDVHLLCLFASLEQVGAFQAIVDQSLPNFENNVDFFGEQFIVDETGDFIAREPRLLITAANLSLENACAEVHELGGLAIPAHVDRRAFGLFANLGFIPPDLPADAIEISRYITPQQACREYPQISGYPLIQNGDVHYLDDFLGALVFEISSPELVEIRLALQGQAGRSYRINH